MNTYYNYNGHNDNSKYDDDSSASTSINHTGTRDSHLYSSSADISGNSLQE
jgi:hypothetical protein